LLRIKHSKSQIRPRLKADFKLQQFEASNLEQDMSVIENIEEIVSDNDTEVVEEIVEEAMTISDEDLDISIQEFASELRMPDHIVYV
jgi:hypothetical protein